MVSLRAEPSTPLALTRASIKGTRMNKFAKGALAGGLGLVLLLGGGATLAYWNDSVPVSGASITAGSLEVSETGTATWTVTNGSIVDQTIDITTFTMVPGDTVTYSTSFEVDAVGTNLEAEAAIGTAALTGDLASRLTTSTTIAVNGGPAGTTAVDVEDGDTLSVVVTIAWPFGDAASVTPDNGAMGGSVNFDNFNVVVTQVVP